MNVDTTLEARTQRAEGSQSGVSALDHPAVAPQMVMALNALSSDPILDPAAPEASAVSHMVGAFVCTLLAWSPARPCTLVGLSWEGVDQFLEDHRTGPRRESCSSLSRGRPPLTEGATTGSKGAILSNGHDWQAHMTITPRFQRLNVVPTYRVLAQSITEMVLAGGLKPGDSLPTESALCEQFGVNRSSVREGIRALEESGLLRRVNSKRLLVSRPTAEELGSQLERGLLLHEVTFQELWETAMVIEPQTAALAATHLVPADLKALEENLRATEAAIGDGVALAKLDVEFHSLLARGVHNRVWQLTREPMVRLFFPAFEAVLTKVPESGRRLLKAHRSIVAVLKAGDAAEAAIWMEKHIRDFKRGFEIASLDLHSPALRPKPRAVSTR